VRRASAHVWCGYVQFSCGKLFFLAPELPVRQRGSIVGWISDRERFQSTRECPPLFVALDG
jgi:hypothetical protein